MGQRGFQWKCTEGKMSLACMPHKADGVILLNHCWILVRWLVNHLTVTSLEYDIVFGVMKSDSTFSYVLKLYPLHRHAERHRYRETYRHRLTDAYAHPYIYSLLHSIYYLSCSFGSDDDIHVQFMTLFTLLLLIVNLIQFKSHLRGKP